MTSKLKQILQSAFYQLLVVYAILVLLISLNLFWKYTLHFEIFALVLAILGISIISSATQQQVIDSLKSPDKISKFHRLLKSKKLHYSLFIIAILLILLFRIIPYLNNGFETPLGYDSGIYKYGIESFNSQGFQVADWVKSAFEPGFLYLMKFVNLIFSSHFILTWLFILFNLILGLSIYFITKEYFNKQAGIIAFLLYAVSIIQFKVFTFMYYKNIIALSLVLWALYFLKTNKRIPFIIFGALTGAFHRPTFYIFSLSYTAFLIFNSFENKKFSLIKFRNFIVNGILILILTSIFYIGFFKQAILPLINPVLQSFVDTGTAPGTFINFFTYQFSTLAYLPFAILGFFALAKNKKFNMLFFWTLITAVIVYFQFFFFNRFIIHLDIALIILAGFGFSVIIENKKKLGVVILILMLFSAGFVALNEARNSKPLITNQELNTIKQLQNIEENAFVMSTSSIYSPWILGYSNRKTIAPGLFDYNKHSEEEWIKFWTTLDINEIKTFMGAYDKPLYIFIGQKQKDNLEQFNNCFSIYYQDLNNKVYKYEC